MAREADLVRSIVDLEDRSLHAESAFMRLGRAAVGALVDRGVPRAEAADELTQRIAAAACGCGACELCRTVARSVAARRPVEVVEGASWSSLTPAQRAALDHLETAKDGTVTTSGLTVEVAGRTFHTRTLEALVAGGWAHREFAAGGVVVFRVRLRGVGACPNCGALPEYPCRWPGDVAARETHERTRT